MERREASRFAFDVDSIAARAEAARNSLPQGLRDDMRDAARWVESGGGDAATGDTLHAEKGRLTSRLQEHVRSRPGGDNLNPDEVARTARLLLADMREAYGSDQRFREPLKHFYESALGQIIETGRLPGQSAAPTGAAKAVAPEPNLEVPTAGLSAEGATGRSASTGKGRPPATSSGAPTWVDLIREADGELKGAAILNKRAFKQGLPPEFDVQPHVDTIRDATTDQLYADRELGQMFPTRSAVDEATQRVGDALGEGKSDKAEKAVAGAKTDFLARRTRTLDDLRSGVEEVEHLRDEAAPYRETGEDAPSRLTAPLWQRARAVMFDVAHEIDKTYGFDPKALKQFATEKLKGANLYHTAKSNFEDRVKTPLLDGLSGSERDRRGTLLDTIFDASFHQLQVEAGESTRGYAFPHALETIVDPGR